MNGESARAEQRQKIKLENQFVPTVRRLLSRMNADFRDVYTATGTLISTDAYAADWEAALAFHYRRVGKLFHIKCLVIKQEDTRVDDAAVAAAFLLWLQNRAVNQTRFILDTSRRDMGTAVATAQSELRNADPTAFITNADVADRAAARIAADNRSREGVIANMETQPVAEQVKRLSALSAAGVPLLFGQRPVAEPLAPSEQLIKDWDTVGDEKVRQAHVFADGQRRNIKQPFNVGGQLLLFPGDTSLGATIDNVANCRCSAQYEVV